jgi:hypothetical protein
VLGRVVLLAEDEDVAGSRPPAVARCLRGVKLPGACRMGASGRPAQPPAKAIAAAQSRHAKARGVGKWRIGGY